MEWIKCSDRTPEARRWVLLYTSFWEAEPKIFVGRFANINSIRFFESAHGDGYIPAPDESITHWAELPEGPK